MTVMPVVERMTAEQYLALPEDSWPRTQLIDGEVVVSVALPLHSYVVDDVRFALSAWARAAAGCGRVMDPLDVQLDDRNVFVPDVIWYAEGRAPARDAARPSPMSYRQVEGERTSTARSGIGDGRAASRAGARPSAYQITSGTKTLRSSSCTSSGSITRPRPAAARAHADSANRTSSTT
jgi:hypothetical protein